jgi:hypothetical protein
VICPRRICVRVIGPRETYKVLALSSTDQRHNISLGGDLAIDQDRLAQNRTNLAKVPQEVAIRIDTRVIACAVEISVFPATPVLSYPLSAILHAMISTEQFSLKWSLLCLPSPRQRTQPSITFRYMAASVQNNPDSSMRCGCDAELVHL